MKLKSSGQDQIPIRGMLLLYAINPYAIQELVNIRYNNSFDKWHHISRIFYVFKNKDKNQDDLNS